MNALTNDDQKILPIYFSINIYYLKTVGGVTAARVTKSRN